ncbi:DUF3152 domain-containing protein [Streptomyces lydicus]|uniref:DUF3152 domain-containing protein n=1 Tax=Streptomyces lydicus TaxID=47763 RepID=UPI001010E8B9|nr:DUF3152 domain-containing protein [Streptomyces lydicus]
MSKPRSDGKASMSPAPPSQGNGRRRSRPRSVLLAVCGVTLAAAVVLGVGFVSEHRPGWAGGGATASPPGDSDARYPADGPGEFRMAAASGRRIGTAGRFFHYEVKVENNLAQTPEALSDEVHRILADPRGWTAGGEASFQQVTSGAHDFTVVVATPGTVDRICGQGGLDTGGEVNCRVGKNVVVNIKRWLLANPYYQHRLPDYHALTINHEVGHFLGHGHASCPAPGRPAPVMMQQIKGLHGCVPNPWPYDRHGTYLTGPPVA